MYAILAQLVEHITRNDEVVGSIPTNGSIKNRHLQLYIVGACFVSVKRLHFSQRRNFISGLSWTAMLLVHILPLDLAQLSSISPIPTTGPTRERP